MNPLELIRREHEILIADLQEFDFIIHSEPINYPNLIHIFKRLDQFWKEHEDKEERVFNFLDSKGIAVPIKKILFEHGNLRSYRKKLIDSINSGSEYNIKQTLENEGVKLLNEIKGHIEREEWVLVSIKWETITLSKNEELAMEKMLKHFNFNEDEQ
ncbi:MAG: hemerythrin domain-containing protein [Nanoarchaeota archaeon]